MKKITLDEIINKFKSESGVRSLSEPDSIYFLFEKITELQNAIAENEETIKNAIAENKETISKLKNRLDIYEN